MTSETMFSYQYYRKSEGKWQGLSSVRPVFHSHGSSWESTWTSSARGKEWVPVSPPTVSSVTDDVVFGKATNQPGNLPSAPVFFWNLALPPTLAAVVGLPLNVIITVTLRQQTHTDNPFGGYAADLNRLALLRVDVGAVLRNAIVTSAYFWNDEASVAYGGSGIAKMAISGILTAIGNIKVSCSGAYGWHNDGVILPLNYGLHVDCVALRTSEFSGALAVAQEPAIPDGFELLDLPP